MRAREGIFLAFQYPVEIPGVSNVYFLKAALNAIRKHRDQEEIDAMDFLTYVRGKMKIVKMDEELLQRPVNEGFSGGEKKRNEIFHMAVLDPVLAVLDETDSGLDIDALKIVAEGVNSLRSAGSRLHRHHPLPAAPRLHRARRRPRHGRRPDRRRPAARSSPSSSKRRATHATRRRPSRSALVVEAGENAMTVATTKPEKGSKTAIGPAERYSAAFAAVRDELAAAGSPRLAALRDAAIDRFAELGFPTTRHEEWRFTNVAPIAQAELTLDPGTRTVTEADIERYLYPDCTQLVVVNGRLAPELSRVDDLPEGAVVSSLADAWKSHPELVEAHLGRYAKFDDHAFVALEHGSPSRRRSSSTCRAARRSRSRST